MNIEQLRSEYTRLCLEDGFETIPEIIEIYKNCLFHLVLAQKEQSDTTSQIADAKIIAQMMFTRLAHIEQVCSGVTFAPKNGSSSMNRIIDATVLGLMIRGIFEMTGMFHLAFVSPQTAEEQLILYNLWVISGLSYRQKFIHEDSSPENSVKGAEEKTKITNFTKAITQTSRFQNLSSVNKQKILILVEQKKYSLSFENGRPKIINGFQQTIEHAGLRPRFMREMYNYFSLHAHPTNVLVFQYSEMFRKDDPEFRRITYFLMRNGLKDF